MSALDSRHAPAKERRARFWFLLILALTVVGGMAIRYPLWRMGPRHSFWWDHDDFARWGILAAEHGPTALYLERPPRWPHLVVKKDGTIRTSKRKMRRAFNYPPLAAYVHWVEGSVHALAAPNRVVNTLTARAVYGAMSVLCDLLAAFGTVMLARRFIGEKASALAGAVVFLAPPLAFDSAFWTQTDAWVLAPLVWMIWAMTTGRWYTAAMLFALALGLKPQGLFAAPIWLYALIFRQPRLRIAFALALGIVVLNVASLPFWATSGATWIRRAYVENIGINHQKTSLTAFNVWYVDQLIGEDRDSKRQWLGVSKDSWSRAALGLGLIGSFVLVRRRYAGDPAEYAILAALCLSAVVMLATRVHERYIVLTIPFVVVAAMRVRRLWPCVVLLLIVASAQITAHNWGHNLAGKKGRAKAYQEFRDRTESLPRPQRRLLMTSDPDYARYLQRRRRDYASEWALVLAAILTFTGIVVILATSPQIDAGCGPDLHPPSKRLKPQQ